MKYLILLLSLAGLLFGLTSLAAAEEGEGNLQSNMQVITLDASTSTIVNELGAILTETDNRLVVDQLLPTLRGPGGDDKPKLEQGDIIVMINGRRVKSLDDFKTVYAEAEPDEEIKLGVKRGEGMQMVKFAKMDPENMPGTRTMMTMTNDGSAEVTSSGGAAMQTIEMSPTMVPLLKLGLILDEAEGGVIVTQLMPMSGDIFAEGDVMVDDHVTAVNGAAVGSSGEFSAAYGKIEAGSDVTLTISRAGAEHTVTFAKPKPAGTYIRKSN